MEPFDYPANDPGRGTLLAEKSATTNLANLHQAMAQITNYTGIMNYMGARFLSDDKAMDPVMRDIGKRGLLFLDDGSTARSLSGDFAKAIGFPHAYADVMIDAQVDRQAILAKLDELERIARRNGQAIGVGAAFDETIAAVAEWRDEAVARGIEFVGVSAWRTKTNPEDSMRKPVSENPRSRLKTCPIAPVLESWCLTGKASSGRPAHSGRQFRI